jgi:DNA polymerase I
MPTLIIDSSYLVFRSFFAYPKLTHNNQPTGAIYGYLKTIFSLLKDYPIDRLVIARDLPTPTWRHQIHAGYKAGRPEPDPDMISQFPILQSWFETLTSNNFAKAGFEADDIIFTAVLKELVNEKTMTTWQTQQYDQSTADNLFSETVQSQDLIRWSSMDSQRKTEDPIYIFSADRDLFQLLIFPNVKILQSQPKGQLRVFESMDLLQKYGITPWQWLDYRALIGDSSDNLPGAMGIGPKTGSQIINICGDLYTLYEQLGFDPKPFLRTRKLDNDKSARATREFFLQPKSDSIRTKLVDSYPNVVTSYMLSCLQIVPDIHINNNPINLSNSQKFIKDYGLNSLANLLEIISQDQVTQEDLFS